MLYFISFLLIALGTPAFSITFSLLSATCGLAIYFAAIIKESCRRRRFWIGTFFYTGVQLVFLSWVLSHPFWYIVPLYVLLSFALGCLFGLLSIFCVRERFIEAPLRNAFFLAGFWTLLEWCRLFWLCGFSWNPLGLSLSASLYAMQWASLFGVFGLTFWVVFTNAYLISVLLRKRGYLLYFTFFLTPFVFGMGNMMRHEKVFEKSQKLHVLLVQPHFPVLDKPIDSFHELVFDAREKWKIIFQMLKPYKNKKIDVIAFPEYVLPFGAYSCVYPLDMEKEVDVASDLIHSPYVDKKNMLGKSIYLASNGFFFKTLARDFKASVFAGLEDVEEQGTSKFHFTSCFHFTDKKTFPSRYDKQVLVPLGEYIPFSFLAGIAESYGVRGTFTHGQKAVVFEAKDALVSPSICYEETFGHLMTKGRALGANLYLNVTNDGWYPGSHLVWQHLYHARLRSVENGVPLVRSCNTGISAGFDAFGRFLGALKSDREPEGCRSCLHLEVPLYVYETLYTKYGDSLIIAISFFCFLFVPYRKR